MSLIFDDYKNFDVFFTKTQEFLQQKNNIDDILQAIEIYECKNYFEEAKIIAKLCQNSLENCSKIGIICNNQNLSQILKLTLKTYQINFNDSSSQTIFDTDIISFLTLLYQVKFSEFNSYNFLAFIKHKFFKKLFNQSIINQLETTIIRSDRESSDFKGFIAKISNNSLKTVCTSL